nr:DNA alkylation repair protein [Tamaricihabitans halophyticus]
MTGSTLASAVRAELAGLADPEKAPKMRSYMRSTLPFRGVPKPERHALARRVFAAHPLPARADWLAAVGELWHGAAYREERYLALELCRHRSYTPWQGPDLAGWYGELIRSGAWWDLVDEIATRLVGPLLRAYPDELTPLIRDWQTNEDLWLRRAALICQVGAKARTDHALLASCVEANRTDPEFFIRKAIGWALRDYAKTAPDWVRAFVAEHPELSTLSRREALRNLN